MNIGHIKKQAITEELKKSYLDYAMSVIVSRALPDVRDGLKPVHRRILYSMHGLNLNSSAKYRKSATIVGDVLGRYHPHGDMAVYEAMVKMAQEFSSRYPMVDGQGNFGCFTKDTKVQLTDGRSLSFEDLVKEHNQGKRNWTFCFNQKNNQIEVTEIKNPRITRKNEKIIEVTLDNQEKIRCTPDHRFMLKDGSYKEAKDLTENDSLMPYQKSDLNIKITSVKVFNKREDVYDLTTDPHHNFALSAGIFVHNSMDGDSAAAMRYCLTGDTLVLSDKGVKPIKEISPSGKENIDYKVLNYKGKKVKANKFFDSGRHKIIQVETEQGYKIRGSYNHPLLCWTINEFGFPSIKWKLLQDISNKDYVLLSRNYELFNKENLLVNRFYPKNKRYKKIKLPSKMNKEIGFLLGAFVAEGSFHQDKIIFNNQDRDYYNKVRKIIKNQFKGVELYEREINGNCQEMDLYHQAVVKFLSNIGFSNGKSHQKEIPFSVLLSKKEVIKSFLVGLFEGDGSVGFSKDKRHNGKSMEIIYDSKSKKLIDQLKVLLLGFGITTTAPEQDKRNECYRIMISGVENIKKFKKEVGFFSEKKKSLIDKINSFNVSRMSKTDFIPFINEYLRDNYSNSFIQKHNFDRYNKLEANYQELIEIIKPQDKKIIDWLLENKYYFNKVKKIDRPEEKERVYSLRVDSKCHSFVAGGFINHNTEAKMTKLAEEMLLDIDKDTVDWTDNYDGTRKEPTVLPAKLPQLLLNGVTGIAVGMATSIPPHNLGELIDSTIFLIDNPKSTVEDLFKIFKGPDFPTGGEVYDKKAMIHAYSLGEGPIVGRAKTEIVEQKAGKYQIIVNEMTYATNKANLITKIADLVKQKKIEGIRDIRDESDKQGVRVVVDLKNDIQPKQILNRLFKLTDLQKTFHLNMLALVDGIQPQILSLKGVLENYIEHRRKVVTRRTEYELRQAKERAHILEGLVIALDHIDEVIAIIKQSRDKQTAHKNLVKKFKLSDAQAGAILEIRLHTLANLEQKKIKDELEEKRKLIAHLESLLASRKKLMNLVKKELQEMKEKYADNRKTKVYSKPVGQISEEELVSEEECVIILTQAGYIKRFNPKNYRSQKRGGRGSLAITTREEDKVGYFLSASTYDDLLFFTDQGRVFQTKAYEIPEAARTTKGKAIVNLLQLQSDEKVTAILNISREANAKYLVVATKNGIIKRTPIEDFKSVRRNGLIAINLRKGDKLSWAKLSGEDDEIMMITAKGQSIRFKVDNVRSMGRTATGVKGITLKKEDKVKYMAVINHKEKQDLQLLLVTENGFGKRTNLKNFKIQNRGGSGIKASQINEKTGNIVGGQILDSQEGDLIAISQKGTALRSTIKDVPSLGRTAQGVRIMRLAQEDKLVSVAHI